MHNLYDVEKNADQLPAIRKKITDGLQQLSVFAHDKKKNFREHKLHHHASPTFALERAWVDIEEVTEEVIQASKYLEDRGMFSQAYQDEWDARPVQYIEGWLDLNPSQNLKLYLQVENDYEQKTWKIHFRLGFFQWGRRVDRKFFNAFAWEAPDFLVKLGWENMDR